jgi:fatty-acyl-CoA synthase
VRAGLGIEHYFGSSESPCVSGWRGRWFPTGDVPHRRDGYMQITDRSKDVIKSGGSWISRSSWRTSRWRTRRCTRRGDRLRTEVGRAAAAGRARSPARRRRARSARLLEGSIAKWQIPTTSAFVAEIPHTATGKIQKLKLREQFKDHRLPQRVVSRPRQPVGGLPLSLGNNHFQYC